MSTCPVRDDVRHTLRALLVHRQEQLATFDRAFDLFWRAHALVTHASQAREASCTTSGAIRQPPTRRSRLPAGWLSLSRRPRTPSPTDARSDCGATRAGSRPRTSLNSPSRKWTLARATLERLVWTPGQRRTRRWVPGRGPRIDSQTCALAQPAGRNRGRKVVSLSCRSGRRRSVVPARSLCCCVTSVDRWKRLLPRIAACTFRARDGATAISRSKAFLFPTQELTRITEAAADPSRRLRGRRAAVSGSGGLMGPCGNAAYGESLREFHQRWVLHGVLTSAVPVGTIKNAGLGRLRIAAEPSAIAV
jgi:uncharacterized protein with von Willebrand factor type A (vWA) domain